MCYVYSVFLLLTVSVDLEHTWKIIVCKSGCKLSLPFLFCLDVCFKTSSVFIPKFDILVLNAKCLCPCKLDFFQRRLNWKNHFKCAWNTCWSIMMKTGSEPIHRLQNNEILHCMLNNVYTTEASWRSFWRSFWGSSSETVKCFSSQIKGQAVQAVL